jgi:hypothetical protein
MGLCWCAAGVYGRVTELSRVSQRRYYLAMALVLGRDLDSIIVDSNRTAQECIRWLRENHVPPMTFFPLDIVRAKVTAAFCSICHTAPFVWHLACSSDVSVPSLGCVLHLTKTKTPLRTAFESKPIPLPLLSGFPFVCSP